MKLKDREYIRAYIRRELQEGTHTFTMCECGRRGRRGEKCWECWLSILVYGYPKTTDNKGCTNSKIENMEKEYDRCIKFARNKQEKENWEFGKVGFGLGVDMTTYNQNYTNPKCQYCGRELEDDVCPDHDLRDLDVDPIPRPQGKTSQSFKGYSPLRGRGRIK